MRRFPSMTAFFSLLSVLLFVVYRYFHGRGPLELDNLIYVPGSGTALSIVTSAFLHVGYFHLVGNLVYMIVIGRYVEDRLGTVRFVLLFLSAAAVGNWLQGLYNIHVLGKSHMGIVGASGAISGILGVFVARFPGAKLKLAYWVFMPLQAYTRAGLAEIPALLAVALWFLLQAIKGLVQFGGSGAGVAYVTHIAGFSFGLAFAAVTGEMRSGRIERLWRNARNRFEEGNYFGAKADLLKYLGFEPDDGQALALLARTEIMLGQRNLAKDAYAAACRALLSRKRTGEAEEVYREALRGFDDMVLEPESQLGLAFGLERSLKPTLALQAYENFQASYPGHPEAPFALLRAANLYQGALHDEEGARRCFEQLIERYPNDRWVDFAREQLRILEADTGTSTASSRRR